MWPYSYKTEAAAKCTHHNIAIQLFVRAASSAREEAIIFLPCAFIAEREAGVRRYRSCVAGWSGTSPPRGEISNCLLCVEGAPLSVESAQKTIVKTMNHDYICVAILRLLCAAKRP